MRAGKWTDFPRLWTDVCKRIEENGLGLGNALEGYEKMRVLIKHVCERHRGYSVRAQEGSGS